MLKFCQLIEKQITCLILLYKNKFRPSRDPQKGYQSTYADCFEYPMSAGSVERLYGNIGLFDNSDFITKELWNPVCKLTSNSNKLMQNLLRIAGVPKVEISPFCLDFTSLIDLHNGFIKFCPVRFEYGDVAGAEEIQTVELSENPTKVSNEIVLERIGQFASDMEDDYGNKASVVLNKVGGESTDRGEDGNKRTNIITINNATITNCTALMSHFKAPVMIESSNDLFVKALDVSACLSDVSTVQGAFGSERKSKDLFRS